MKLNNKRTVLIGLAFMSILAFWQFYDQVIPYILENVFGLTTLRANSIMAIDAQKTIDRKMVKSILDPLIQVVPLYKAAPHIVSVC